MPTLSDMQEQATVLLVSVQEQSSALLDELKKLGVKIVMSDLPDCEERMDEEHPDLVVLLGARGAMELATLIEGHEGDSPPRMVIAAERRELSRLRGLNREVVVSLFGLEAGESVVAQRIESLARRAARRRSPGYVSLVPQMQKTSLGLPSGEAIGKIALKSKSALESAAKPPAPILRSKPAEAPAFAGKHEPGEIVGSGVVRSKPAEAPVFVHQRKPADDVSVEAKRSALQAEAEEDAPDREDLDSLPVLDDELMSLRPSEMPEDGPEPPVIPVAAKLPTLDDVGAPLSIRPELPPSALTSKAATVPRKAHASRLSGEIDISEAEAALDQLDLLEMGGPSVTLKDENLSQESPALELSTKDSGPQTREEIETVEAISILPDSLPPDESERSDEQVGAVDSASPGVNEQFDDSDRDSDRDTPHVSLDPSLPSALSIDDELSDLPPRADEMPPQPLSDGALSKSTATPEAPKTRGGKQGSGLWAVAVLLAVGLGGAWYFRSLAANKSTPISASSQKAEDPVDVPLGSSPKPAPEDGGEADAVDAAAAPDGETASGGDLAAAGETQAVVDPFRIPDTKQPDCQTLLAGDLPTKGKDPVHEASLIWDQARKLIVAGKVGQAHRKMCEAVFLNEESAAIEGLAGVYLDLGSTEQALYWADRAEKLRPGQRELANLRGDALSTTGELEKARSLWLGALLIKEDEQSRIKALSRDYAVDAGIHLRRGDIIKAERWFRRAVILDPENLGGLMGLARAYRRAERVEHAKAAAHRGLLVSDLIPELHVLLGEIALEENDKAEAKLRFEKALAVRPGFFPAKRGLIQVEE